MGYDRGGFPVRTPRRLHGLQMISHSWRTLDGRGEWVEDPGSAENSTKKRVPPTPPTQKRPFPGVVSGGVNSVTRY